MRGVPRPTCHAAPRLACTLLCAAALAACIERPFQEGPPPKAKVDRAALRDVLLSAVPEGMVPVGALFGNAAELVGYRVEPPQIVPGQRLRITLLWRCKGELEPWHVFVHLDDPNGGGERIHAEHEPAGGRYPTDAWRPGELIADSFAVSAGRTPLGLYLGFYSTGETRLTLNSAGRGRDDGANRLLAGTIPLAR
jgi:hypothetical protein